MWTFKTISDFVGKFKKIVSDVLVVGSGTQNDIEFDRTKSQSSRPKIRFNSTDMKFQYTLNGTDWFNFGTSSPGGSADLEQVDVTVPSGVSTSAPHVVDVPISYTVDFKRREPTVLKFVPGSSNVTRTICAFDLTDNTKFTVTEDGSTVGGHQSKYVVWDGQMKFKTSYVIPMKDEGTLGEGKMFSIQIIKSPDGTPEADQYIGVVDPSTNKEYKFKDITGLNVG